MAKKKYFKSTTRVSYLPLYNGIYLEKKKNIYA